MAAPRPAGAYDAYTTYSGNFSSSGVTLSGTTLVAAGTIAALFDSARVNPLRITAGGTLATGAGGIGLIDASTITSIVNSGVIGGSSFAISISSNSTLGALINSGTILGAILNYGSTDLTLGGGTAVGTYTGLSGQGTITNTLSNLILTGSFLLNDAVNVSGHTLINSGASVTLTSIVTVTGDYTQASGTLALSGAGELVVSGSASLTGGRVNATLSTLASNATYLVGDAVSTLVAAGSGSYSGVTGSVTNNLDRFVATIGTAGGNLLVQALNDYIGASTPSLTLTGTVDTNGTTPVAAYVVGGVSIGTLVNTGHLTGDTIGLSIGTGATIGTLVNAGLIDLHVSFNGMAQTGIAVARNAVIGALSNTGTLQSVRYGITAFNATVGLLSNSGTIRSTTNGIGIYTTVSTIQTLINSGTIDVIAGSAGILSSATIGTLVNSGTIIAGTGGTAGNYGIVQRTATIGTLVNSGLISAPDALVVQTIGGGNSGAFLTIVNSGTIAGNISTSTLTNSVPNVTVLGGTAGTVGTLTGYPGGTTAVGVFTNTTSDLYFAGGNLLLNDRIDATGHTVLNTGAALTLVNPINVTGAYAQTGGSLVLTNSGALTVSGSASLTNATVSIAPNAAGNYIVGSPVTVVAGGGGSDFTGMSISLSALTGASLTSSVVGNSVLVVASNDYIGSTLATLTNSGSLSGATVVYIAATGSLGQLVNTGTLSGDIRNLSANTLSISGGTGGVVGTLTGGTLSNSFSDLVLSGGSLLLDDAVNVSGHTLANSGASVTLASVVGVTGNYAQTAGTLILQPGAELVVTGAATMTGGSVIATLSTPSAGVTYLVGDALSTLVSAASGAYTGLSGMVDSGLGPLTATLGTDSANLLAVATSDYIGANAASLTLTGTVDTGGIAAYVADGASIGTLVNRGHLTAGTVGAGIDVRAATIGTLINDGLIDARVSASTTQFGIRLGTAAAIGTVSNTGTILAHVGILSQSRVATLLSNGGRIALGASGFGIVNNATVATVSNSGTIAATAGGVGIYNVGTIGAVLNSGLITVSGGTGNQYGILQSQFTMGTVINSGTILAPEAVALVFGGSIGTLVNAGLIAGNIVNGTLNDSFSYGGLTIAGGNGGTIGTFTGYAANSQGTISNTFSNVVFTSGALLLNDAIDAAGHTVINTGAGITLANTVSITGDYAQTGGSLSLSNGAQLIVSGAASLTGARVSLSSLPTQANYVVGAPTTVVVGGAGSDYTGASITVAPQTGITLTGGNDGTNLLLMAQSDYVGGTLATLTNSGTVSAPTALYIAATGSLGQLVNTGTLSGTIVNLSAVDLSIMGGTAGTVGVLTGGTIINTLANLVLAGGLRLGEGVNVSGHTLVNAGATLTLPGNIGVTGDYTQTGGTLVLGAGGGLAVSGTASITGAAVIGTVAFSYANTYLLGDVLTTLVSAASGTYSSLTGTLVGTLGGVTASIGTAGANLVAVAGNYYINSNIGSIGNTGTATGRTAFYLNGTLGTLANSGTLTGTAVGISSPNNRGIGLLDNSGVIDSDTIGIGVGSIGTLLNSGTISARTAIIGSNFNTIGAIDNQTLGLITGKTALYLNGTVSPIGSINNSGTILGQSYGLYNGGNITRLTNSGTIAATVTSGLAVNNSGSIGTFNNSGSITAVRSDMTNSGTIDTLTNSGAIGGGTNVALRNYGTINTLTNSGTLMSTNGVGFYNDRTVGLLDNGGTISSGASFALVDSGTIARLANSGTITSPGFGIGIFNGGKIGTIANAGLIKGGTALDIFVGSQVDLLVNSGTIAGNIDNNFDPSNAGPGTLAAALTIAGGTGGTIGTLTGANLTNQGRITTRYADVVFAGGDLLLNDNITTNGFAVRNTGAGITVANTVNITGGYIQTGGSLGVAVGGGQLAVSGSASLTNGQVQLVGAATNNYFQGGTVGTLVTGGAGSDYAGVTLSGDGAGLSLAGVTIGNNLIAVVRNDYIGGTYASLGNTGTLSVQNGAALYVAQTGTLGTLANTGGVISSVGSTAIANLGTIGTLSNSGTITGGGVGLHNTGLIHTLTNDGTLGGLFADGVIDALANGGTIGDAFDVRGTLGLLSNSGSIGTRIYVELTGGVGTVVNSIGGVISGAASGIGNAGSLGTLVNRGLISGAQYGVFSSNATGTVINSGTIQATGASGTALYGSFGTILNSGLISGANALSLTSQPDLLNNSGTILGDIQATSGTLTITGGTGTVAGTFSGATVTNRGTITVTSGNVILAGGNILLNDNVVVSGHTLINNGANLQLAGAVSVTGGYSQTVGTLGVTVNNGLTASGVANITGGTVLASLAATGNYLAGTLGTLVAGANGSSYGATVVSALTGLAGSGALSGGTLLFVGGNDYIGGAYATLSNSGSLSAATAVYIAATGSLGNLSNTGTLVGNVRNLSAVDLSIAGGTTGAVGTFTGGTLINTLSNVVLASGNVRLADAIDVTGHTLVNSAAALTLGGTVAVTGDYSQTGGGLRLGIGSDLLSVTGAARFTGGAATVTGFSATGNYMAGSIFGTLVQGGAGSDYSGLSITDTVTGFGLGGTVANNALQAVALNDYVGGTLAALSITGAVSTATTALYVAATASISGTLTNSTTLVGQNAGLRNVGTIGALLNDGTIAGGAYGLRNSGGAITFLGNHGTLAGQTAGLAVDGGSVMFALNDGSIATVAISGGGSVFALGNMGRISGGVQVQDGGRLGSILNFNSGVISGATALNIGSLGQFFVLANGGTIAGNIINNATATPNLTITGGTLGNTTIGIGTFTGAALTNQGIITNTLGNVIFASGDVLLNDSVNVGGNTVRNTGADLTLTGAVSITGNYAQTGGTLVLVTGAGQLAASGSASLNSGQVQLIGAATGNYLQGGTVGTLVAGGAGSDYAGVVVTDDATGLTLGGAIAGAALVGVALNDYIGGTYASLGNTGTLGVQNGAALYVAQTGTLGTLANTGGVISSVGSTAIANLGTIGTLSNSGTITGAGVGLHNTGLIHTLTNDGTLGGLFADGVIDTLVNSGTIGGAFDVRGTLGLLSNSGSIGTQIYVEQTGGIGTLINTAGGLINGGTQGGVLVESTIATLSNAGTILGDGSAVRVRFTTSGITALANGGVISGTASGIENAGSLGTLVNSGTILGTTNAGIGGAGAIGLLSITSLGVIGGGVVGVEAGTLGTLINQGTIAGGSIGIAAGTIGLLANAGIIKGDVATSGDLTVTGGSGTVMGIFTGATLGSQGALSIAGGKLVLAGGNVLLNDSVQAATVANTGGYLALAGGISVTGAYSQTAGTLGVTVDHGLTVSGVAGITGGTVLATLDAGGNYLAGTLGTLVAGAAGSDYSGAVVASALTGLTGGGVASGDSLLFVGGNDYIGGAYATLSNSGSLSAATAVYIAASGSLGRLANTGTLAGNIRNLSSVDLSITGGTGGTVGTFTGGTIVNSLSNVVFASGDVRLADAIDATGHAVVNSGANLALGGTVAVTGDYDQTGGSLRLGIGSDMLSVTGAARFTGGTATITSASGTANYMAGSILGPLVQGGAGSDYTGLSITNLVTGFGLGGTVANNALQAVALNDYIGGALATLSIAGAVNNASTALYVAATGSLGTLTNSTTLVGQNAGLRNVGTVGTLVNDGAIGGGTYGLRNSGGLVTFLDNLGTLTGQTAGLVVDGGVVTSALNVGGIVTVSIGGTGTLLSLDNQGQLSGGILVTGGGRLDTLGNSGTIAGDIRVAAGTLTITGGSGAAQGTFTGGTLGSQGTIAAGGDVVLASGNIWLNDSIQATGHTMVNAGANLQLADAVSVTGAYSQTAGTLGATVNNGLTASGAASIIGGIVLATLAATGNYLAGTLGTLVAGGNGSNYSGATVSSVLTGLTGTGAVSGDTLLLVAENDYIGSAYATLTNSGSLSAATAVYIAAGGSLGQLANTGTLSGNIRNLSAVDLSISGGGGGTVGTFTGGTIVNSLSNVMFASGDLLLADAIDATGHTVVNQSATLRLASQVSITGAYAQTGGTLSIDPGTGRLVTSQAIVVSGGVVQATLSAGGTYLYGNGYTLMQAGGGIDLGGANLITALAGFAGNTTIVTVAGTSALLLQFANDYIGGTIGSASNSGTITGVRTAGYVAATGSVGTLSNTGLLSGGVIGVANNGVVGTLVNDGAITGASSAAANIGTLGTLANSGTITGGRDGFHNVGTATLVSNTGLISAMSRAGLYNGGGIATVSNSGTITGTVGLYNSGTLAVLMNAAGGTLAGVTALYNHGTLGTIANSGMIRGAIVNDAAQDLVFTGAGGGGLGTLTGLSGRGTITNTRGNVVFAAGALLLDDDLVAAGHAVVNSGATLALANAVTVSGDYSQVGGSLVLTRNDTQAAELVVSGTATVGGTVLANLSSTANYLVGTSTLLQAAGGATVTAQLQVSGVTGLSAAQGAVSNGLTLTVGNDYVGGSLGSVTNSGALSAATAIYVAGSGTLATLVNSGLLAGTAHALVNLGSLGTIANSGTIAGDILNDGTGTLVITGGAGTLVGTLTGRSGIGTLTSTGGDVVFAGGTLLLNDMIAAAGHTVSSTGASLHLASTLTITGDYRQTAGSLALDAGQLVVTGVAVLSGGTVAASVSATSNQLMGAVLGTLVVGGTGSSYTGLTALVNVASVGVTLSTVTIGGTVDLLAVIANNYVGDTLGSLGNSGVIEAPTAVHVAAGGTVGSLSNTGTLIGTIAVLNQGQVGSFSNDGTVLGSVAGISNSGTIGTLGNQGTVIGSITGLGNQAGGSIGTLSNSGTVAGQMALYNAGTIDVFVNNGALIDAGAPTAAGLYNTGNIATVLSSGTILGATYGVYNAGTIGTLANSGLITAPTALYIDTSASLGVLANSGTVTGNILNLSANDLRITGGSGTVVGTLTGYTAGSQGSIINTLGNVNLASGNLLLNDAVNVAGHTLVNSGASVILDSLVSVTGNYSQSAGTLTLDIASGGALAVSGAASLSGGTVLADYAATGNFLAGSATTLVAGGVGSSYVGVVVQGSLTGLVVSQGVAGTNLLAVVGNDYVGGTLGNLSNTGTLTAATAVYIAASGSLGTLANSGALIGDLLNTSSHDLVIVGGSGTTTGLFTGGTIHNSLSNLGFASGTVSLGDAIDVTGHTVSNNGANITLASDISVTGAYSQSAGTLDVAGHSLNVSGAATVSGGTVSAGLNGTGNYLVGDSATLIQGGAGSNYAGAVVTSGVTGLSATGTTSGTNLLAVAANDYIGGTLNSLAVTGSLTNTAGGATAIYIASTGTLGTLANSGTVSGNITNAGTASLSITGGTGGTVGTLTGTNGIGTITSTLANVELAGGNLVLNDQVNVGSGTLVNSGANVLLTNAISVTGNYAQSAGTLAMGIGSGTAGELLVSGNAAFTGGTVAVTALSGSNLIAGQSYTIAEVGGSLTTSGLSAAATGFSATLGTGANGAATDLLLTLLSDYVSGTLGTLSNTGTINAATAVLITSAGSLGTLANSGAIIGNVVNASANDLVVVGGSNGTVGSFSGGTIRNSLSNLTFASGAVSLGDAIDVTGHTVSNSGAGLTLASDVAVTGNYSQTAGTLSVAGHSLSVSGAAQVTGGVVDAGMSGTANYLVGDSVTLIRGGNGSTYTGATVVSGLTGLDALGSTSGSNLLAVAGNDYIGASLAVLNVTGTLANTAGGATALYIASTGTLGALANSGTISGNVTNVSARDLSITGGSGTVVGAFTGGTIRNTGANVVFASGNVSLGDAIDVGGTHTVSNIGAAIALTTDVGVNGTYAQSAGSLNVGGHVLTVSGPALVSGGTVSAGISGVGNYLVSDSVTLVQGGNGSNYSGATVVSGLTGLDAKGSVSGGNLLAVAGNDYIGASLNTLNVTGTLANTAGGATALYIAGTGTLGALANSGTIAGNITNLSAGDLSITGGSNGAVGVFTGGTIRNAGSNVVFASGAVSLGDAIVATGHTVANSGASISLASDISVTGAYSQSTGTLSVAGHVLSISDAAVVSGGVVNAGVSATGNYIVGDSVTLIQGGTGSSYSGATVVSGLTGLSANGGTSGGNLLAVAGNDYVGGTLNTLNVTGTLANTAGGATALYIASTGTLGTLANSGTISGNITNLSANDLMVAGGTDSAPGTLTGGIITNTRSDLRFVRGVMMLNDRVNVGSHSVVNNGATLLVNSAVNITGSYSQTAGSLVVGVSSTTSYGSLVISGSANLTGGSVTLTAINGGQLSAGSYTIASAGSTLTTSNLTLTATGYTVTSSTITANGATDLILTLSSGSGGTTGPTGPTISTQYTAVGLAAGGPGVGTGRALDVIANSSSATAQAFQTAVLTRLSKLSGEAQQLAVTQLSPSQLTPQINTFSVTPSTNAISLHQQHAAAYMDGPMGDVNGKGAAAGSDGQQGAVWGEILGGGVLRGNNADAAGYSGTTAGLVLGVDWYANDTVMAGLAFSWLNGSVNGEGTAAGSQTKAASYQLTAYSVWRPDWADQRLSVEGQASFGYNHYDQRRWIGFLGARANANYGGEQYLGKVTVGYDLPVSASFTLTPQASLRAVRLTNHAYDEHDAGVANMAVGALKVDNLTQELGAELSGKVDTAWGRLLPDLRLAWVHDYLNGPIATTSVLAGTSFVSSTGRTAADGLGIGVGATLDQGDGFKLRLEYSGELRRDYQSHAGVLHATFDF
ncbi:hypothetical protein [Nitrospirillum viridazoti]|uniref:Uncharacterized protein with beta-barrel porin domain n=3 Tax=Nitrospirillum TaxID=1543705 RepID=A0A560HTS7_9PROT|nr:hypothetical protein [Nitrospirillum amazonense]TWB48929.1 uncharacterized protein with beta-barrel porin domain [Nitrospirillum amazonense]